MLDFVKVVMLARELALLIEKDVAYPSWMAVGWG